MPNVFSIDLEDWFHLLDNPAAPDYSRWEKLESRVRANAEVRVQVIDEQFFASTESGV